MTKHTNDDITNGRQPQTEELVWLPFPENKPEVNGEYLVQFLFHNDRKRFETCDYDITGLWFDGEGYMYSKSTENLDCVLAWAEKPKGYKEK